MTPSSKAARGVTTSATEHAFSRPRRPFFYDRPVRLIVGHSADERRITSEEA